MLLTHPLHLINFILIHQHTMRNLLRHALILCCMLAATASLSGQQLSELKGAPSPGGGRVGLRPSGKAPLQRVPGIGPRSAERIVRARRTGYLDFDSLKRMGVVLKRAHYFILCRGKQLYRSRLDESFIRNELISMDREKNWREVRRENWRQLDLFRDFGQEGAV